MMCRRLLLATALTVLACGATPGTAATAPPTPACGLVTDRSGDQLVAPDSLAPANPNLDIVGGDLAVNTKTRRLNATIALAEIALPDRMGPGILEWNLSFVPQGSKTRYILSASYHNHTALVNTVDAESRQVPGTTQLTEYDELARQDQVRRMLVYTAEASQPLREDQSSDEGATPRALTSSDTRYFPYAIERNELHISVPLPWLQHNFRLNLKKGQRLGSLEMATYWRPAEADATNGGGPLADTQISDIARSDRFAVIDGPSCVDTVPPTVSVRSPRKGQTVYVDVTEPTNGEAQYREATLQIQVDMLSAGERAAPAVWVAAVRSSHSITFPEGDGLTFLRAKSNVSRGGFRTCMLSEFAASQAYYPGKTNLDGTTVPEDPPRLDVFVADSWGNITVLAIPLKAQNVHPVPRLKNSC